MRNISVSVDRNGHVSTNEQQLGYSGEHNAVTLTVSFTDDGYDIYSPCEYFRIIIDGNYSDELYMENKSLNYPVPQQCMTPPVVHGQLVGYTTADGEPTEIIKSEIFEFEVDRSQVTHEKAANQPDVFERALAECKNAAGAAKSSAEIAAMSAQEAKESAEISKESQTLCENYAAKAESIADKLEQREVDLNNLSNAIKGRVSGSEVVLQDVSPLEHELSVKLSGDFSPNVTETVSAGFSQKGDTLMLPAPVANVMVNIIGGVYTVGVIVPIIDGVLSSDLLTNAAIPVQYAYGEAGAIMELEYSVSGSVVSWSGFKNWSGGGSETSKIEISGSYDTGVSGIAISGFVQPYGLDEDNPYFQNPERNNITFDITATATTGTTVKVTRRGKNLFSGFTKGIGLNSKDGSEITDSKYAASDYIPADFSTNNNYYISGLPTTISNFVAAYNANKEFLGRTGGADVSNRKLVTREFSNGTPQGTGDIAYLRVTCYKTSATAGTIDDIDDCNIQLEIGSTATEYESYNAAEYTPNADGTVEGVTSLYPTTTLSTDTDGVIIDCEYNRDINKAFAELQAAIISLGGNV